MKISLIVLTEGSMKGKPIPIKVPQFIIGRDPKCQLRPASPLVSIKHCALVQRDGKLFVKDFKSTNGTFVNEKAVEGEVELQHKDNLRVGPVAFSIRIEADSPLDKPTPPPATKKGQQVDDEDAAALLLSIGDEATPAPGSYGVDSQGVPLGSTVMDVLVASGTPTAEAQAKEEGEKKDDKSKDKAKAASGDTASAAESILQKYMRRPRTPT
jgi:pSer/pThr/pTyr-binding forkhead associated (FHA) protein